MITEFKVCSETNQLNPLWISVNDIYDNPEKSIPITYFFNHYGVGTEVLEMNGKAELTNHVLMVRMD